MTVQDLVDHVGCGDLDIAGACAECNAIRALLKTDKELELLLVMAKALAEQAHPQVRKQLLDAIADVRKIRA